MSTRTNIGKCRLCDYSGKLYGRQCWRCRKRHAMRICVDCGKQCNPDCSRCLRCSNRYQAMLRGRPENFDHDKIRQMFEDGLSLAAIARVIGCTKNSISGYVWRQGWYRRGGNYTGPTTLQRLKAMNDRMDAIMAEIAALRAAGRLYRRVTKFDEAA